MIESHCAQQASRAPARQLAGAEQAVLPGLIENLNNAIRHRNLVAAVKTPKALSQPNEIERFRREIAAMGRIAHPNLIRLLEADGGNPPKWFAMDYHATGPLEGAENRAKFTGRPLSALAALRPVADALASLHREDVIHRDVKPNNIFVADDGSLVLGDLGIVQPSSEATRLTETGNTVLSRDWAPDWVRFNPEAWSPKADVFALAKIVHYLIAGKNMEASQSKKAFAALRSQFPDVRGLDETLSLLTQIIVTDEDACSFGDGQALVDGIDEILEGVGALKRQTVFSFLSTHSTTDVGILREPVAPMPALAAIPITLPFSTRTLAAKVRIHGDSLTKIGFQIDSSHNRQIDVAPLRSWPGMWHDVDLSIPSPLRPGLHELTVLAGSQGASISGFLLCAERSTGN